MLVVKYVHLLSVTRLEMLDKLLYYSAKYQLVINISLCLQIQRYKQLLHLSNYIML